MANVDNNKIVTEDAMINKVWISRDSQHANAVNIRVAPNSGVAGQQTGGCANCADNIDRSARIMLRNVGVNIGYIVAGLRRIPQLHRPIFFQSAAISSSLTNSPRLACSSPSAIASR